MSASSGDLLTLVNGADPVAVVFYRDEQARAELLGLCEMLARDRVVVRTATIDDAFRREALNDVLLLIPEDETGAVRRLDGQREKLINRGSPAILFLLQGGSAEEVLHTEASALSSFLRGLTYDPEPMVGEPLEELRDTFTKKHGMSPDDWLIMWRRGDIGDTGSNNLTAHEAWSLRMP